MPNIQKKTISAILSCTRHMAACLELEAEIRDSTKIEKFRLELSSCEKVERQ